MSGEIIPWLHARYDDAQRLAEAYLARRESEGTDRETWAYKLILADLDAKRRILGLHRHPYCDWCADGGHEGDDGKPCPHLALLALPFDKEPGYQERWRP